MQYVYIKSEPRLYTVGFYDPSGVWHPESDHDSTDSAAERVHFLNGGSPKQDEGGIIGEWKAQAEKDGNLADYEYHLGMVEKPLPYRQWVIKNQRLNDIQNREDYADGRELPLGMEDEANRLCRELGY